MRVFVVPRDPGSKAAFIVIARAGTLDVETIDILNSIRRVTIVVDAIATLTGHPTTVATRPACHRAACVAIAITCAFSIAVTRSVAITVPNASETSKAR